MKRLAFAAAAALALCGQAHAQSPDDGNPNKWTVHGSVQAEILFPETDYAIGAKDFESKVLTNDYADAGVYSKYLDAGLRFEYLQHPLPGFEPDFKGWGVPYFYAKGKFKGMELTGGDFYEQFGAGFILRTYEERSLGIDNSIRGGRLKINTFPGFRFTALGGFQRVYWDWRTSSQVYGADAEVDLQRFIPGLASRKANLTFGASWVLKNEHDEIIEVAGNRRLNLPRKVNAMDLRLHFLRKGLNLEAEFAMKSPDPSYNNNYTFSTGTAVMLTASYSRKGLSWLLQAKRSEDMSFRSRRSQVGMAAFINNMPPFAYQHTYALATLNPYATQMAPGEWAFQANFTNVLPKGTPIGGRYGATLRLNASGIWGFDNTVPLGMESLYGTDRQKTGFFKIDKLNYCDVNMQLERRMSRSFTLNFMYSFQKYNKTVVEGHGGMVNSNIFILEGKWRMSKKLTLRTELQYLTSPWWDESKYGTDDWASREPGKDWAFGLIELSIAPYLMISASDQWNHGDTGTHYYMFNITGNYRANRLMIGYGRTRAGYNCSGGVCRWVPATRGFTATYSFNF